MIEPATYEISAAGEAVISQIRGKQINSITLTPDQAEALAVWIVCNLREMRLRWTGDSDHD